jgi:hypothetical protein
MTTVRTGFETNKKNDIIIMKKNKKHLSNGNEKKRKQEQFQLKRDGLYRSF